MRELAVSFGALIPGTKLLAVASLPKSPSGARPYLVKDTRSGQHYVLSGVVAPYSGWEVLAFKADETGEVTDWMDVAGGRGVSFMEAAFDLDATLDAA